MEKCQIRSGLQRSEETRKAVSLVGAPGWRSKNRGRAPRSKANNNKVMPAQKVPAEGRDPQSSQSIRMSRSDKLVSTSGQKRSRK